MRYRYTMAIVVTDAGPAPFRVNQTYVWRWGMSNFYPFKPQKNQPELADAVRQLGPVPYIPAVNDGVFRHL